MFSLLEGARGRLRHLLDNRRPSSARIIEPTQESQFQATGRNFFKHTYRLLESVGAFNNSYLPNQESCEFFTDRVGAYMLEGLFPHGNNRPFNGKPNRINHNLHAYLLDRIPIDFSPLPGSEEQIFWEIRLNEAARETYEIFYADALRRRNRDELGKYFLLALKDQHAPVRYYLPEDRQSAIREALLAAYADIKEFLKAALWPGEKV